MRIEKSIWTGIRASILAMFCLALAGCVSPGPHGVQGSRDQTGTITIVKDAAPDSAQDFAFYSFGPNSSCCTPFQLDDDADPTLSNSQTFTLEPGSYSFTENFTNPVPVTGWTLASITCTGGDTTVDMSNLAFTANLAAGDDITCTFHDTPTPATTGTITIIKDAVPDSAQDFAFYAFGPNSSCCMPFQLDDDADPTLSNSKTFTLAPGDYSFVEDFNNPVPVTGWALASITCTGGGTTVDMSSMSFTATLAAGQDITCTFVDTPTIACTAWPMSETVYVYNPGTPFGPQTVNICAGGTVTFVNVNSGIPYTVTYLSGPVNFGTISVAVTNGSVGTTIPLTTSGTYQYMLDTGSTIPGTIIVN